jgi:hypothetical protein
VKIFFIQIGHYEYQKIQNFTLILKMFTYQSDEMHPKKVLSKKLFKEKNSPQKSVFGPKLFLGAF